MFLGEYQHTLDIKARVIVPAKFREGLGAKFVATKGLDHCIFLYPLDQWSIIESKVQSLSIAKPQARLFARTFFSGAAELETDKQGRFVLPQNLREHANIEKELMIIGVGERVEIWSADLWASYNQAAENSYEMLAESLEGLGL